jgi:hypothetical protein
MWGMASDMVSRKWRPQIDTPAYECQLKVQEVGSDREEAIVSRKDAKRGRADALLFRSWRLCVLSEAGVRTTCRFWGGMGSVSREAAKARRRLGFRWPLT